MPNRYTHKVKLLTEHTDANANLRLDAMLKFFQEASIEDATNLGAGRDLTLSHNCFWVIGKERAIIDRLPKFDEEIVVSTWPGKRYMFLFPRYYEIKDKEGKSIVKATSYWSLIDIHDRRPIDPDKRGITMPDFSDGSEIKCPMGLRLPELPNKIIHKPSFSELDYNGHVNNTSYINIAQDLVPNGFIMSHEASEFEIQWKREMKLGEEIEVEYGFDGDAFLVNSERFAVKIIYR